MSQKNSFNAKVLTVMANLLLSVVCIYGNGPYSPPLAVANSNEHPVEGHINSSHDGFYKADSIFYQLSGTDSFLYCVNCYSADSLKKYKGGVWLYSREHAPNTWENSQFSMPKEGSFFNDTGHIRADVVKANTIWVRVFNGSDYIDEHHLVFLGNWRPKTAEVISVFLDSSDFMGPDGFYGPGRGLNSPDPNNKPWNYYLKLEKKCSYQVFGGTNLQLEAAQTAGIELSSQQSQEYPNKSMQLNANKTSSKKKILSIGKSLTDSLGSDIKILRLRVGGPNIKIDILTNEIAQAILDPRIGGEPSTPVCLFVNGSFWTYTFAEENLGRNHISKVLKTSNEQLKTAIMLFAYTAPSIKKMDVQFTQVKNSVYAVVHNNETTLLYMYKDTVAFVLDTVDKSNDLTAFADLNDIIRGGSDSLLAASINRESFYKYALSIWFFQNEAMWGAFLTAAKAGTDPWTLIAGHYYFEMPNPPTTNDWNIYFTDVNLLPGDCESRKSPPWLATRRMLDYDRDYFCLVFEDELNTTYKPERVVNLAKKKIASLRPCIAEGSKAWYPFCWPDSSHWEGIVSRVVSFLGDRTEGIAAALPKDFMTGADTLWELKDRNKVTINLDKVRDMHATVKLNSLEVDSNFSGLYYPKPDLRISLQYNVQKYKFVKWLEYPDAPATFTLSANKPVTLTPMLIPK